MNARTSSLTACNVNYRMHLNQAVVDFIFPPRSNSLDSEGAHYARLFLRAEMSASSSTSIGSAVLPRLTFPGDVTGSGCSATQAFSFESSPPVRRTLF